jgi:phosphopantetheinyl transferase (holo-ACP synthase)
MSMSDSPRHLGNDVVALAAPRCRGKAKDSRFLSRILSPEEQEAVLASPNPDLALWLHWAGKEAAFKSATKARGAPPVFEHRAFKVTFREDPTSPGSSPLLLQGKGTYQELSFHLQARIQHEFVHALAWTGKAFVADTEAHPLHWEVAERRKELEGWVRRVEGMFSYAEWGCIHHPASAFTRLQARAAVAAALNVEESRLEIRCGPGKPGRTVPLVFLDGRPHPVDLTLSHDAHLMAWAFLKPEPGPTLPR